MNQARCLIAAFLIALSACGGSIGRQVMVEGRRDSYESLFDALIAESSARGLDARPRRSGVSVLVDATTGARITFTSRRNGVQMSVGVRSEDDDDTSTQALAEAELTRLTTLGQELFEAARQRSAFADQQRALAQAAEQEERARREAAQAAEQQERARREELARQEEEARRAQQPSEGFTQQQFADFMGQHNARMQQNAPRFEPDPPRQGSVQSSDGPVQSSGGSVQSSGGSVQSSGGSAQGAISTRCCINGAYYDCPSVESFDRCGGAFARCLSSCGMSCVEQCLSSNPPDPSQCARVQARDGEC
jgi:hypothetical protein